MNELELGYDYYTIKVFSEVCIWETNEQTNKRGHAKKEKRINHIGIGVNKEWMMDGGWWMVDEG